MTKDEFANQAGRGGRREDIVVVWHLARSLALQALFEAYTVNHDATIVLNRHLEGATISARGAKFAAELVHGVQEHTKDLDLIIAKAAPHWPIDQMSAIDKSILRLAIFEILYNNKVPVKAVINEAVELAKEYGSDNSSRFVNGVLGTVVTTETRQA